MAFAYDQPTTIQSIPRIPVSQGADSFKESIVHQEQSLIPLCMKAVNPAQDVPSTSTKPRSNKPPSRAPLPILRNEQPSIEKLAKFGVKVRDFAYESTLPPVRTIYRHPRQVQPSVPRQIQREDTEPEDGRLSQSQSQPQGISQSVKRTLTEPVAPEEAGPSQINRMGAFLGFPASPNTEDATESQTPDLIMDDPESSQMTPFTIDSQDSEVYVHTPIITPSGSMQWDVNVTSSVPTSQMDTDSQMAPPEVFSYSQLGISRPASLESQQQSGSPQGIQGSRRPSPLSQLPQTPSREPSTSKLQITRSGSITISSNHSPSRSNSNETIQHTKTPPYYLRSKRKRTNSLPIVKPTKKARIAPPTSSPSRTRSSNTDAGPSSSGARRTRGGTSTKKGKRRQ